MTALRKQEPTALAGSLASAFARRARNQREARALMRLQDVFLTQAERRLAEARQQAVAVLAGAQREIEALHAAMVRDAEALLAELPDFGTLEKTPASEERTAFRIIRRIADEDGLAMAAVAKVQRKNPKAYAARVRAVKAVAEQCDLSEVQIGVLFGVRADTIRKMLSAGE